MSGYIALVVTAWSKNPFFGMVAEKNSTPKRVFALKNGYRLTEESLTQLTLLFMASFYAIYILKMMSQKKKASARISHTGHSNGHKIAAGFAKGYKMKKISKFYSWLVDIILVKYT